MNAIIDNLKKTVKTLSNDIGKRNHLNPSGLKKAVNYIKYEFEKRGYAADRQIFKSNFADMDFENIIATKAGSKNKDKIIVVGAHYDTYADTPGADDNASAVAVLLELAGLFSNITTDKTIRFVAFANEEPPFFKTKDMGSLRYAKLCKSIGEDIEAMICLESVGYFSDKPKSQNYPKLLKPFYPDVGSFISIVSDFPSRKLLASSAASFKKASKLSVASLWAPATFINTITLSDHWSFWKQGYKALMICDTAFFRNPHYHTPRDTFDTLDYNGMSEVTDGTKQILLDLCGENGLCQKQK